MPEGQFDFIIVGGGSAGAVIASRLSEDPSCMVALVEAGGHPPERERIPMATATLQCDPEIDWMYRANPGKAGRGLKDGRMFLPRGKMLGGSSGMNYMAYVRGHPGDFDKWESLGADGWSYDRVLPYFKKSERFNATNAVSIDPESHSGDGPLGVSVRSPVLPPSLQFISAAVASGIPEGDYNGADRRNPAGVVSLFHTTTEKGQRSSTYHAFLEGTPEARDNLTIVTKAHVTRVLLDGEGDTLRASGIEYEDSAGTRHRIHGAKEVILSAGAIGSPHILLLSGIGPRRELEFAEIECRLDSPHVGKHLKDHLLLGMIFDAPGVGIPLGQAGLSLGPDALRGPGGPLPAEPAEDANLPDELKALKAEAERQLAEYLESGSGYASSSLYDAGLWCQSGLGDEHSHDIQIGFVPTAYGEDFFGDLCNLDVASQYEDHNVALDPMAPRVTFVANPVLQRSEGEITIRSADPHEHPQIDLNYYGDPHDLKQMVAAMRLCLKLAQNWPEPGIGDWFAPPDLAKKHGYRPGEEPSDAFLENVALHYTNTIYHQCCSCRIGDVVDPRLRVLGVDGLRVADASVMPDHVSANTNAACIMIGEKAAEMIASDNGVRLANFVG
ncbi:GMC family oxidoreductase [Altererythrobacter sp. Z27]|uniref:GMC family oxidoreductase n=1 Tax=Altererythrobacter sp. Z27 TaxID=3461147 RepID=UPI0040442884